ncbi:pyrroline-5-carboxylate reductase (plasmid) [Rhizobium sp. CB3060]|uniref:pyrroline-5-carboxylate reductase n=1 Tax=Rhizobium sp. CB3060 TaxID=3138255 RepID=UPI0021A7AD7B|nr:pyrroline-5-carboxylate reductase [Rhizobium tropici]UWU25516.1 pyrroline-5-carboxylate reductase [Rhizobium tropici]
MSVLVLGCGNMGAAIASGVDQNRDEDVVAVDPDAQRAKSLLPPGSRVQVFSDLAQLTKRRFDIIIIGVKPNYVGDALQACQASLAGAPIVSIAAGVSLATMREVAGQHARLIRVMPNLAASVGAGMTVGYADNLVDVDVLERVERVFEAVGRFHWVSDEHDIDKVTAVAGSGPGYVFAFTQYLEAAAVEIGLPAELAAALARQTVVGAGRMLERDQRSAIDLKRAVTSPKGTTEAGLSVLEGPKGLPELLDRCVRAAEQRAIELR